MAVFEISLICHAGDLEKLSRSCKPVSLASPSDLWKFDTADYVWGIDVGCSLVIIHPVALDLLTSKLTSPS